MTTTTALLAALSLAASPGAPPSSPPAAPPDPKAAEGGPVAGPDSIGDLQTPPGSPEDVALWERGVASTRLLHHTRAVAMRLHSRIKAARTVQGLEALVKAGGPAAKEAEALKAKLLAEWNASITLLNRIWPVDPVRGCFYPTMDFDAVLHNPNVKGREASIGKLRQNLVTCIEKADLIMGTVRKSSEELLGAIVPAEKAVAAARSASEAAKGPAEPAKGSGEVAKGPAEPAKGEPAGTKGSPEGGAK